MKVKPKINLETIPYELILHILEYTDVKTISTMSCVNVKFNKLIKIHKWDIIDGILDKSSNKNLLPVNSDTYKAYKYVIDFGSPHKDHMLRAELISTLLNEKVNIRYLVTHYQLDNDFLSKNWHNIQLSLVLQYQKLHTDVILDIMYKLASDTIYSMQPVYWEILCRYQYLPLFVISQYSNYINWFALSENKDILTKDVLEKYKHKLIWPEVTKHGLVEDLIKRFIDYMNVICWQNISCYSKLSKEFITEHLSKLDIPSLIVYQTLDNDTIQMLIDSDSSYEKDVLWEKVCQYQFLSYDFIMKNKEQLQNNLQTLIANKKILRKDLCNVFGN